MGRTDFLAGHRLARGGEWCAAGAEGNRRVKIAPINGPEEAAPLSEARYASGFGCVRCGCTVFRYCIAKRDDGVSSLAAHPFLLCPTCLELLGTGISDQAFAAIRARPMARRSFFRTLAAQLNRVTL